MVTIIQQTNEGKAKIFYHQCIESQCLNSVKESLANFSLLKKQ